MPDENLVSSHVTGSSILLLLDTASAILIDVSDMVAGDPDVQLATAALAEQVRHQLQPRGHREALRSHQVIRDTTRRRARR